METFGCTRVKTGDTTYYITKMAAGELINKIGVIGELPVWPNMTNEERKSREYDIHYIVEEIVPHIIEDTDYFFSSFVVGVFPGFDQISFEPLTNVVGDVLAAYEIPIRDMGFITFPGKERLIALHGQDQLLGLRIAIQGLMGVPAGTKLFPAMYDLQPHPELANEEFSIILVGQTADNKIRKICNNLNQNTGQASRVKTKRDNDIFATISSRLIGGDGPLAPVGGIGLVNTKSNILAHRCKYLTTLRVLYKNAEILLEDANFSPKQVPPPEEIETAYQQVSDFWTVLLNKMHVYREYRSLTLKNLPVSKLREENLLMRPVPQMTLAYVALIAWRKKVEWADVAEKLDNIDWSIENNLWKNIFVIGDVEKKLVTGKKCIRRAGTAIAYMVMKDKLDGTELNDAENIIENARNGARP